MSSTDDLRRYAGVVVLVTGAGHGIGRAVAARLAHEGARIGVTDRDGAAAQETVDALGQGHLALTMDVTDRDSVDAAVVRASAHFGQLDVLVNVAGGDTDHGSITETDDSVWHTMLDLNLVGVARCCRATIPYLRQSTRNAAIVTVSSINALAPLGSEPYSSAKAGVGALTANLASSLGADGIRVNAVAPATIRTRVWDDQPGGADRLKPLYPLGRVGEPEDVAAAVAFLGSADAGWITGHTLPVDGGLLVRSSLTGV